jgi:copper(I)-binding protein
MACRATTDGVEVTDVAMRVAPSGATVAAAYATIRNRGNIVDTLLGVSSDVGGELSLHRYVADGGMATMRGVAMVALPPGATVRLVPGGMHAMLEAAGQAIAPGRVATLTFRFATAPAVTIAVPITTITGEE